MSILFNLGLIAHASDAAVRDSWATSSVGELNIPVSGLQCLGQLPSRYSLY